MSRPAGGVLFDPREPVRGELFQVVFPGTSFKLPVLVLFGGEVERPGEDLDRRLLVQRQIRGSFFSSSEYLLEALRLLVMR